MSRRFMLLLLLAFTLSGCSSSSRFCFFGSVCFGAKPKPVTRGYTPEKSEFSVFGTFNEGGESWNSTHTFSLGEYQVMKGRSYGYDIADHWEHGEDAKLFYLTPEKHDLYMSEYVIPGKECPSSFMHQNLKIHVLVGANESISKELRKHEFKIEYGGAHFAYGGHFATYSRSLLENGPPLNYQPVKSESAYSNVGYADIPYDYFVVTEVNPPVPNEPSRQISNE